MILGEQARPTQSAAVNIIHLNQPLYHDHRKVAVSGAADDDRHKWGQLKYSDFADVDGTC